MRDWIYKNLAPDSSSSQEKNFDFKINRDNLLVRSIAPKVIIPARERFKKHCRSIESDCILWYGAAVFRVDEHMTMTPRRFIWWDTYGEQADEGLALFASCKTRNCVNVEHLVARKKRNHSG